MRIQIRDELAAEMLKYSFVHLGIDHKMLIERTVQAAVNAIIAETPAMHQPEKLQTEIEKIRSKKTRAIDHFLSGDISKEELHETKLHYDTQLESLRHQLILANRCPERSREQISQDIRQAVTEIVDCVHDSEAYMKALLEHLMIRKDGLVEVKLLNLPAKWTFRLLRMTEAEYRCDKK